MKMLMSRKNVFFLILFYFILLINNLSYCQPEPNYKENSFFSVVSTDEKWYLNTKTLKSESKIIKNYLHINKHDPFKNFVYFNGKKGGDYKYSITFYRLPYVEKRLFDRINNYRKKNGLNILKWSEGLSRAGSLHIDYCAQTDVWKHEQYFSNCYDETLPLLEKPSDRIKFLMIDDPEKNKSYIYSAENLYFYGSTINSETKIEEYEVLKKIDSIAFYGWKYSPGHNENMLLGMNEKRQPSYMGISVYLFKKEYYFSNNENTVSTRENGTVYYEIISVMLTTYDDPFIKGFKDTYRPFFPTIVGSVDSDE
ncbi:MAG: CAP domain-containing protein [Candidatus Woesearchaeota archaeon]